MGNGIVAGTIGADGRWLALGIAHPRHGRVVLTCTLPFEEEARHDQTAVRGYRAALAHADRPGLGLACGAATQHELLEDALPRVTFQSGATLTAVAPAGRRGAVQLVRGDVDPGVLGSARLARADYTQLTEGGPLPLPVPAATGGPLEGQGVLSGSRWMEDPELGAVAVVLAPSSGGLALAVAFGADRGSAIGEARALAEGAESLLAGELAARSLEPWVGSPLAVRRAMSYALDCASCDIDGVTAILADHEILPLVWTRDAYYVARMLLAVAPDDRRARATVQGFLRWCFERAERPDGWWPRSSLAGGQVKDRAFQLDQQLYPPLLLAEHARLTGDPTLLERYGQLAEAVLDALIARADGGLIATAETPADDPLAEPFHFSSHLLLWRTLAAFGRDSDALRARIRDRFTRDGRFAYAVGPSGDRQYHDANDLPTALAPQWGFCEPADTVWRATVDFAWSGENAGFIDGPLGGLGSLHTRHPWALGDLQRVIVARGMDDAGMERLAWDRLERVETWDGLLPEAYDERTGEVASRHWFAWPVALRALLQAER